MLSDRPRLRRSSVRLLFSIFVLAATDLSGQVTFAFIPPNPTSQDIITVDVGVSGNCPIRTATAAVVGNVVQVTVRFTGCSDDIPPFAGGAATTFGPLPEGTYVLEVYFQVDDGARELRLRQSFAVGAAIPTFAPTVSAILGVALAAVAASRLRG
jgi:hypothetical protein